MKALTHTQRDSAATARAAQDVLGPLTVIRGYLDALKAELAPVLSPDQSALLDRVTVSADRLAGSVGTLMAMMSARPLRPRETRLDDLYAGISRELALRAKTTNRLLSIDIPHDLPSVAADTDALRSVLVNAVDAALIASREGGQVAVAAKVDGDFVRVRVIDTGDTTHSDEEWFAAAKAIVAGHGGKLTHERHAEDGASVTFTLPVYRTVATRLAANERADRRDFDGGRLTVSDGHADRAVASILLVEPDRFIGEMYTRSLRKAGYDVTWLVDAGGAHRPTFDVVIARDSAHSRGQLATITLAMPGPLPRRLVEIIAQLG